MKLEELFVTQPLVEVAELLAVSTANLYMLHIKNDGEHCDNPFEKIRGYLHAFPRSRRVRSAYAMVCAEKYTKGFNRFRDVPPKVMKRLKDWYKQYPDEIEFRESYFHLLWAHLEYTKTYGMRAGEMRTFHEMEQLAKNANYDDYFEENQLQEEIKLLRKLYRY